MTYVVINPARAGLLGGDLSSMVNSRRADVLKVAP
jgi:hypothetical protein